MFTLCINGGCPFSCWCKRFTYGNRPDASSLNREFFNCEGDLYVMNKAREIYERDNPDDSIYEQFKPKKHKDNNRESRVRKNNDLDRDAEEGGSYNVPESNSVLQLQRSGYRRSDIESSNMFEQILQRVISGELGVSQGFALLSDTPLDGVSSIRTEPGSFNGPTPGEGIRETGRPPYVRINLDEVLGLRTEDPAVLGGSDTTDNRRGEVE